MKKFLNFCSLIVLFVIFAVMLSSCGHEHSYNEEIVKPTCTERGYTIYTCECGDTYKDNYVSTTSHVFTTYVYNEDATCTADGTKTAKCDTCDVTDTVTANGTITNHEYDEHYYCEVCFYNPKATIEGGLKNDTGYSVSAGPNAESTDVYIPMVTFGEKVTGINENGFRTRPITSVYIPDTVTFIGDYAFEECSSLTTVTIPGSITSIGARAFNMCENLEDVYFEGTLEDWCGIVFETETANPMYYAKAVYMLNEQGQYYKVSQVTIPDTITKINSYAFCVYPELISITVPDSVTYIADCAFKGCAGLVSITLPFVGNAPGESDNFACIFFGSSPIPASLEKVTITGGGAISSLAFVSWSTTLNSVALLDGVTSIGSDAFNDCSSLASIQLSNKITSIGGYAFYGTGLYDVYFHGTREEWTRITIEEGNERLTEVATTHYYSESEPTDNTYSYWHFDTDGITPIVWGIE